MSYFDWKKIGGEAQNILVKSWRNNFTQFPDKWGGVETQITQISRLIIIIITFLPM